MGRQIGIAMTERDEEEFLEFLLSSANIQLIMTFSDTERDLFIDKFPNRNTSEESIKVLIWNNDYGLKPGVKIATNGKYYVPVGSGYPVLEYTSHRFCHRLKFQFDSSPGRLYWAGTKIPTDTFDQRHFEKWYNKIVHWVKSRGEELKGSSYYYMPNTSKWYK